MKLAREYAERAIALDPTLAQPYATIGFMGWHYEWDWKGSDEAFKKAIELDPSYPTAHHWYAYLLVRVNRMDEAVAEITRAQSLDPLSQVIAIDTGEIMFWAGRFQESIKAADRVAELSGEDTEPWFERSAYAQLGDDERYLATQHRVIEKSKRAPDHLVELADWYYHRGDLAEARKIFAELRTKPGWSKVKDPVIYLSREEVVKRALEGYAFDYRNRGAGVTGIATNTLTARLRSDPRIQEFIHLTGLAEYALPASN